LIVIDNLYNIIKCTYDWCNEWCTGG